MDRINFTGGFLLHKPTPRMWEKVYNDALQGKKRIIINDLYEKGDIFFATKNGHDSNILKYLLSKRTLNFKFYPNISTKNRLDSEFPQEAIKILDSELAITSRPKMKEFIKPVYINPNKNLKYRWKENDHIEQTFKALKLDPENYVTKTQKHMTVIYDRNGVMVACASPNSQRGINYVYQYSNHLNKDFRMLIINHKGEILAQSTDINRMQEFKNNFIKAVKIDSGRTRPTKKV